MVLTKGEWKENEPVLVRINSSITNNDILTTLTSTSNKKLDGIFSKINESKNGVIVFINQPPNPVNVLFRLNEIKNLSYLENNEFHPIKNQKKIEPSNKVSFNKISSFMINWSNKFVVIALLTISAIALSKQAWA